MSRKYTLEFKAKIVFEVLQGDRKLGEIAADNKLKIISSRICSATGKKNSSTMLLLYLMTSVRITSKKSLLKNARKRRSMPKRLVS